jgi:hypothetical protein
MVEMRRNTGLQTPSRLNSLIEMRKSRKQEFYMPVRDPIGGFAQIERSEAAIDAAFQSEEPIYLLYFESDESAVAKFVTTPMWVRTRTLLQHLYEALGDGLLHILHTGWFDSDDSRLAESFRYSDDLYRSLCTGFEEYGRIFMVVQTPRRESVISIRKHTLKSQGPLPLIEL